MTNPIELAKAATPWWMRDILDIAFLAIEPTRDLNWSEQPLGPYPGLFPLDHETRCSHCAPEDAHFWAVYGCRRDGSSALIEDFADQEQALAFTARLRALWPHLQITPPESS